MNQQHLYSVFSEKRLSCQVYANNPEHAMQLATLKGLYGMMQAFELCQNCENILFSDESFTCKDCQHKIELEKCREAFGS